MRVTLSCRRLGVPQQLADDRQAEPTTGTKARIGVPKIMKADAFEPGTPCYRLPWTLEIRARLFGIIARHDVGAEPIEAGQDRKCRSVKDYGLPAGLGVGEK